METEKSDRTQPTSIGIEDIFTTISNVGRSFTYNHKLNVFCQSLLASGLSAGQVETVLTTLSQLFPTLLDGEKKSLPSKRYLQFLRSTFKGFNGEN